MDASPPNESLKGNAPTPTAGGQGEMPPDHRFNQSNAQWQRLPKPATPGEGIIPVTPYTTSGLPNQAGTVPEMRPPK